LSIPTNNGTYTKSATATLGAVVTIPTPVNPTFTPDGNGGGSFAGWVMPAGATEAYVQVVDYGPALAGAATQSASCNGSSEKVPVFYTLQVEGSAALGTLADTIGPNGAPSLCTAAQNTTANGSTATTGDQYIIQVVAFDYPAFESSYPSSLKNPAPTITGSAGTDDLAISGETCVATDGTACDPQPLMKKRQFAATYAKRPFIR
jgi:hypothetical protein